MTKKIIIKSFYDKNSQTDYKKYHNTQVKMWDSKRNKRRSPAEYEAVYNIISQHLPKDKEDKIEMICLGARNNHERDCFDSHLKNNQYLNSSVYSLDISPDANVDYIYDFGNLPKEWTNRFDIVYTNAPDHSFDFFKCINEWHRIVKEKTGILIMGISDQDIINDEINGIVSENIGTYEPHAHDCTKFEKESVDLICKEYFKNTDFIHSTQGVFRGSKHHMHYNYWLCKK